MSIAIDPNPSFSAPSISSILNNQHAQPTTQPITQPPNQPLSTTQPISQYPSHPNTHFAPPFSPSLFAQPSTSNTSQPALNSSTSNNTNNSNTLNHNILNNPSSIRSDTETWYKRRRTSSYHDPLIVPGSSSSSSVHGTSVQRSDRYQSAFSLASVQRQTQPLQSATHSAHLGNLVHPSNSGNLGGIGNSSPLSAATGLANSSSLGNLVHPNNIEDREIGNGQSQTGLPPIGYGDPRALSDLSSINEDSTVPDPSTSVNNGARNPKSSSLDNFLMSSNHTYNYLNSRPHHSSLPLLPALQQPNPNTNSHTHLNHTHLSTSSAPSSLSGPDPGSVDSSLVTSNSRNPSLSLFERYAGFQVSENFTFREKMNVLSDIVGSNKSCISGFNGNDGLKNDTKPVIKIIAIEGSGGSYENVKNLANSLSTALEQHFFTSPRSESSSLDSGLPSPVTVASVVDLRDYISSLDSSSLSSFSKDTTNTDTPSTNSNDDSKTMNTLLMVPSWITSPSAARLFQMASLQQHVYEEVGKRVDEFVEKVGGKAKQRDELRKEEQGDDEKEAKVKKQGAGSDNGSNPPKLIKTELGKENKNKNETLDSSTNGILQSYNSKTHENATQLQNGPTDDTNDKINDNNNNNNNATENTQTLHKNSIDGGSFENLAQLKSMKIEAITHNSDSSNPSNATNTNSTHNSDNNTSNTDGDDDQQMEEMEQVAQTGQDGNIKKEEEEEDLSVTSLCEGSPKSCSKPIEYAAKTKTTSKQTNTASTESALGVTRETASIEEQTSPSIKASLSNTVALKSGDGDKKFGRDRLILIVPHYLLQAANNMCKEMETSTSSCSTNSNDSAHSTGSTRSNSSSKDGTNELSKDGLKNNNYWTSNDHHLAKVKEEKEKVNEEGEEAMMGTSGCVFGTKGNEGKDEVVGKKEAREGSNSGGAMSIASLTTTTSLNASVMVVSSGDGFDATNSTSREGNDTSNTTTLTSQETINIANTTNDTFKSTFTNKTSHQEYKNEWISRAHLLQGLPAPDITIYLNTLDEASARHSSGSHHQGKDPKLNGNSNTASAGSVGSVSSVSSASSASSASSRGVQVISLGTCKQYPSNYQQSGYYQPDYHTPTQHQQHSQLLQNQHFQSQQQKLVIIDQKETDILSSILHFL